MNNLSVDDLKKMQLLGDRVLVLEQGPLTTKANIQLLSNEHKWDRFGTVVKVGPGNDLDGMPVEVGQTVAIGKEAGMPIVFDLPDDDKPGETKEVKMLVIRLMGILAIIEEDEKEVVE